MNIYDAMLTLILAFTVSLQASEPPSTVREASERAERAGGARLSTEIIFDKSSSNLTSDAQKLLRETLESARQQGTVKQVKVLAWADTEYPKQGNTVDKNQRKLADDRSLEIKNFFVDRAPGVSIDTINMSEGSENTIEKLTKPSDARIKRSLEQAGITDPRSGQNPPKASHAVVLFILK